MFINSIDKIWGGSIVLREAFKEYSLGLKDVYLKADEILKSPSYTPEEFSVSMDEIPQEFFSLRKNIFSTLFQSMYHLLGIRKERRMLYGKLNHLFRIWVTSADNLLDKEDKIVIPMRIFANSHTMRQVISIMTADRILKQLLDEAVEKGTISLKESKLLSDKSLQILLPSAAEEASEENGIGHRPNPDYVLYTIHRLKTGILFHIPFLGPESLESKIDSMRVEKAKDALDKFGLGCQLLDDIRDMAKDYLEKRHNYVLSMIYWKNKAFYNERLKKIAGHLNLEIKIFSDFPKVVYPTAELANSLLREGLLVLKEIGLDVGEEMINAMALSMFYMLGVGELIRCLNISKTVRIGKLLPQDVRSDM